MNKKIIKLAAELENKVKNETEHYFMLFESLTIEEIKSISLSNKLDEVMKQRINIYISFRTFRDLHPLIGYVIVASLIMEKINEIIMLKL